MTTHKPPKPARKPTRSATVRNTRALIARYAHHRAALALVAHVVSMADTLHFAYQEGFLCCLAYRSRADCPFPLAGTLKQSSHLSLMHARAWYAGYDSGTARLKAHMARNALTKPGSADDYRRRH